MKMIHLSLTLAGLGVLLIVLSFAWPSIIGTHRVWSDQQAREHAQAAADLHQLQHERIHDPGDEPGHAHPQANPHEAGSDGQQNPGTFEAAKDRYERSQAELDAARSYRLTIAMYLKCIGVVCALFGVVGYLVLRAAGN